MKSPRQLVFGSYVGEAGTKAASTPVAVSREMLAGVALLVLAVATDHYSLGMGDIRLRFELIVGGLLAAWFFVRGRGAVLQRIGIIEYALLGWLAANIFSSLFFSPSRQDSLKNAIIIAGVLTIYLAGIILFNSAQAITWAAAAWVAVGAVVALIGLLEAALYTLFGTTDGINLERAYKDGNFILTPRVESTMWEPNIFGSFCATVGILALALTLAPDFRSPSRQRWLRFAAACAFCGIMLSMTRTVWMLAPLILAILMAVSLRLKLATARQVWQGMLLPAGIGIVVGLVVGNFFMPTLTWQRGYPWNLTYEQVKQSVPYLMKGITPPIVEGTPAAGVTAMPTTAPGATPNPAGAPTAVVSSGSTLIDKMREAASPDTAPSIQGRLTIFRQSADAWLQRPVFGWGTGSFALLYPPDLNGYWISNLELHLLFDTGIVGFLFFTAAIVIAARKARGALRTPASGWHTTHFVLLGLLIGGVGLLVAYQLTEATWMGFTWAFLALLVMAAHHARPPLESPAQTAAAPDYVEANARQ
ncbi:MAG: O-antigen ligase family protein [Chloroflexota bacterium]